MQESVDTPETQHLAQVSHESQSDQQNNAAEAPVPDSGSVSISSNDSRKVSREDIELVWNFYILSCILFFLLHLLIIK